jgi:hypothetical protein
MLKYPPAVITTPPPAPRVRSRALAREVLVGETRTVIEEFEEVARVVNLRRAPAAAEGPWFCEVCDKLCKSNAGLKAHQRLAH